MFFGTSATLVKCQLSVSKSKIIINAIVIMSENTDSESDNRLGTIKDEEENSSSGNCVEPNPGGERQDSNSKPLELFARQKKGRKKPEANAWSTQTKALFEDETAVARLYEHGPFENPALERCRKNAIRAKLNRERKKRAREQTQGEIDWLRSENARLRMAEPAALRRAAEAERELQRLRAQMGLSTEVSECEALKR